MERQAQGGTGGAQVSQCMAAPGPRLRPPGALALQLGRLGSICCCPLATRLCWAQLPVASVGEQADCRQDEALKQQAEVPLPATQGQLTGDPSSLAWQAVF